MCLIIFAYNAHPDYRLIVVGNRDEFYERPTAPLSFWPEHPSLLAGKDLVAGGTWMGITTNGRFAAITNYRSPKLLKKDAKSRGPLVSDFLKSSLAPKEYLKKIAHTADQYNPFNLLVRDNASLMYLSSVNRQIVTLKKGIYGLSNHLLDTTWPKVERGKAGLKAILSQPESTWESSIFELLSDQTRPPENRLPDTGVGIEWEKILSPLFITSPTYGTRSSTILLQRYDGHVFVEERNHDPDKMGNDAPRAVAYNFKIE